MLNIVNGKTLRYLKETENAVLIDVRTPEEYASGNIPGSININIMGESFQSEMDAMDKTKTYVMICRSGARSGQACMFMNSLGFENINNLEGGMMNWDGEVQ